MIKKKIDPNNLIWKPEYNIGNFKVDLEHRSLFDLAKKALGIRKLNNDEKEIEQLKAIIKSLYKYVAIHFKNEEEYMLKLKYPDFSRHKQIHNNLLTTLNEFIQTLNDLDIDVIEQNLFVFIEDYFIDHIVNEDMEIGTWAYSLSHLKKGNSWRLNEKLGNETIDKEHQKLFTILEEAFEVVNDNDREHKIKTVIHHLYNFMKEHFHNEETLMRRIQFPGYEEHKKSHNIIVQSCNELLLSINSTDEKLFEKRLALFIEEHIVNHMLVEDKKIVEYEKELESL